MTGLYLMFFYIPSASRAYQDIIAIENSVAFGSLIPEHAPVGAHLMVLTVFLRDPGLLPRAVQAAAGVELGGRRDPSLLHAGAELHRVPPAVGPDRVLGR